MKDTLIIIMLKDKETGIMTGEAATCAIYGDNEQYIDSVYAVKNDDGGFTTFVKLTAGRDSIIEDWQFDAVYDYYDDSVLNEKTDSVSEVDESYVPTWEASFTFSENDFEFLTEKRLNGILDAHKTEIAAVFEEIRNKGDEYAVQEMQDIEQ